MPAGKELLMFTIDVSLDSQETSVNIIWELCRHCWPAGNYFFLLRSSLRLEAAAVGRELQKEEEEKNSNS